MLEQGVKTAYKKKAGNNIGWDKNGVKKFQRKLND